jgi:NAD(P)-dependent dehydrogenase (short-subunit alcohol dehydrogenase family)
LGLESSRVLIAGAGGIGATLASAFSRNGAAVTVFDRDEEQLSRLRASLTPSVFTLSGDATDRETCDRIVEETTTQMGGIDVFIHAIGINRRIPILDLTDDDWHQIVSVNLDSAFWLGRSAGRVMVNQKSGSIIYLSSVSGLLAHLAHAPYAATKGGVNQLLRVMAREWAPFGVTVNAIAPGYVETELTRAYLEADGHREQLSALVPMGRLGTPEELAGTALYLASPLARFVTGQIIYVDGGRTLV